MTKVLIKFISPCSALNVVGAAAVEADLLVTVGYGDFLSDAMRARYNYFFHRRKLAAVLTDPVRLERNLEADIEIRLSQLLEHYKEQEIYLDITDADPSEALALGIAAGKYTGLSLTVLSVNIRESIFHVYRDGEKLRRLKFPSLTYPELRYLRDGTKYEEPVSEDARMMLRKDLDRSTVKLIRALCRIYYDRPMYWSQIAAKLSYTTVGSSPGQLEYILDASVLTVRDEAFEELVERGILSSYQKQSGIIRLRFPDKMASRLLLAAEHVPVLNIFLTAALVREYGQNAAYHDLQLRDFRIVTCIRKCLPVVIGAFREEDDVLTLYEFCMEAAGYFEEPSRKILVTPAGIQLPASVRENAKRLGVELTEQPKLAEILEPK